MQKLLGASAIGILLIAAAALATFSWKNLRGIAPALRPPTENIAQTITVGGTPLTLPADFNIEIFADNLPGVRVLVRDDFGNFWVSQPSQGTITQLEINRDTGRVRSQNAVFRNLRGPHGLALHPDNRLQLYIAEEHRVSRVPLYSDGSIEPLVDLPADGGHSTRTLGFGPDNRLYVSIGSSCNVCEEADDRRAKIFSLAPDGSDFKEFARGLRNAVFFTWHPTTEQLWATEMGRDLLGDDLPPDEINIVRAGGDYGWPNCFGQNVLDTSYANTAAATARCTQAQPAHIELPAHSAPLGLAFVPRNGWPEEFQGDLLVAYHGSWNRSEPTGYKVVRINLDKDGRNIGTEDFITGWLAEPNSARGRPVDIRVEPGGIAYISDDKAGVIYKVTYAGANQ